MMCLIIISLYSYLVSQCEKYRYKQQRNSAQRTSSSIRICFSGKPRKEEWVPILRFDRAAKGYCFPDHATPQANGKCNSNFNNNAPVYYEEKNCSNDSYKIAYWWFYGQQQQCFLTFGKHDNDWEHVILQFSKHGNSYCLNSVQFYQHSGYYTRQVGKFEIENNRRVVAYVGKISHGNYHTSCRYKVCCMWDSDYCIGGCGYWDDFRNPLTDTYKFTSKTLLHIDSPDQSVRKTNKRDYCNASTCKGASVRVLTTSGCWQNDS